MGRRPPLRPRRSPPSFRRCSWPRRRKEQKMAERLAAQLTEVPVEENKKEEVKTGTGRILDMVEKQEQNKEEAEDDTDTGGLKKKDVNARGGRRRRGKRCQQSFA